jgi:hypothetical protein
MTWSPLDQNFHFGFPARANHTSHTPPLQPLLTLRPAQARPFAGRGHAHDRREHWDDTPGLPGSTLPARGPGCAAARSPIRRRTIAGDEGGRVVAAGVGGLGRWCASWRTFHRDAPAVVADLAVDLVNARSTAIMAACFHCSGVCRRGSQDSVAGVFHGSLWVRTRRTCGSCP